MEHAPASRQRKVDHEAWRTISAALEHQRVTGSS
jgi:hypothetical protein